MKKFRDAFIIVGLGVIVFMTPQISRSHKHGWVALFGAAFFALFMVIIGIITIIKEYGDEPDSKDRL